jgi:hypothetical protein
MWHRAGVGVNRSGISPGHCAAWIAPELKMYKDKHRAAEQDLAMPH